MPQDKKSFNRELNRKIVINKREDTNPFLIIDIKEIPRACLYALAEILREKKELKIFKEQQGI